MAKMSSNKKKLSRDDELSKDIYLPTELLMEILARLPSKTLLRFRSVCKTWCSLIDSSNFISLHLKLYNNNSHKLAHHLIAIERFARAGLFTIRLTDKFKKIANLVKLPKSYSISGSCNGLILLTQKWGEIILWNPSIRRALLLSSCPFQCCALGFSPSRNDYKVLAFGTISKSDEFSIAVYSLNDHLWRKKPNRVSKSGWGLSGLIYDRKSVCCGGTVYWIGSHIHKNPRVRQKLYLYDFDAEEFSVMQLPDAVRESIVRFIFKHGESLAVFSMSSERSCIWVLEKDGGKDPWGLWFSGDPNLNICKLFERSIPKIVYVQKSNMFLLKTPQIMMSYNIASNQTRTLGKETKYSRISFETYVESLVLHKGFGEKTFTSFL